MAAKSAIGMMRNEVMERFAQLPGFIMPTQGKDPDLLHVQQLQAILEWIDCQQEKPVPIVEPTTYERLEAFAAAVNVEDSPIKQPTKPAPKAKRK